MSLVEQNKLLSIGIPHGVFFAEWLVANGWSNQLVKCYCDNGWLKRLCRGVAYREGDYLTAYAIISSYYRQIGSSMHIAAHSALETHGYMHFVPLGKPRLMVALPSVTWKLVNIEKLSRHNPAKLLENVEKLHEAFRK